MGCNQSSGILNIDLSSTNVNKSEIIKLIIEEYDLMLVEIQQCRKQINLKTGFPMNEHSLGQYKSDYFLLNQFIQQTNQDKSIEKSITEEISLISLKLKCLSKKYANIKLQFDHLIHQEDQINDYFLQLQWKDQVLLNYFFDQQKINAKNSTPNYSNILQTPQSRKSSSTVASKTHSKSNMSSTTTKSNTSQQIDQNFNRIIQSNFF